ncbi:MAG TPA: zeta toxin family protein [Acidobacteriaceae bacterium]
MTQPLLTILAGSNGSGKSTLTSSAREGFQLYPVLDPDALAKSIRNTVSQDGSDIEAGKQMLRRAEELLEAGQSFTVETTLSGSTYLRMSVRAKEKGYRLAVIFVGTSSVEINLERVRARVLQGGHDVAEEDQRRRYPRTLANIQKLLPMADLRILLDNSTPQGYELVAVGAPKLMEWIKPIPDWAKPLRSTLG